MKTDLLKQALWGCLTIVLTISSRSYSQNTDIQFERISTEAGLSQSSILAICQDRMGFLWFGTYEGLNRYDGSRFKVYKNNPGDPYSLSKNNVECILEDHEGVLWIGTEDGLNRFDREKERFIRYKNNPNDSTSLNNNFVRYLYEDRSGTLWIGTQGGGLNKFDRNKQKFYHYANDPANPKSLSQNNVLSILEDRGGHFWVGTDGGLNNFDRNTGECIRYVNDPKNPNSISHNSVWRIYEDGTGNLWIGTWGGGLDLFDPHHHQFIRYQNNPNDPSSLSQNIVRSICQDHSGNLWIGTYGGGLNRFVGTPHSGKKGIFVHYRNDPGVATSLSGNSVFSIFEDKLGILWIGTNYNGIDKYNPSKSQFMVYRSQPDDENSLSNNSVSAVCADRGGIIWAGTLGGGLNRLDRKNNRVTHHLYNQRDPHSLSSNSIRSIFEDRANQLWVGTETGLNYFDERHGKFIRYQNDPNNPQSISNNNVWSITQDRKGNLWVGTFGGGINRFNPRTRQFVRYVHDSNDPKSISDNFIWTIHQDTKGIFWIGTLTGGLNRFDPNEGTFSHYQSDSRDSNSISDNKVLSLFEDRKDNLWVGTANGLNKFDRKTGTFTRVIINDGLPNSVHGILEDGQGYLWISTNHGLTKFNPGTGEFKNYYESDGLQGNEFTVNSYFKMRNGEMIFGGINGLSIFHPENIHNDITPPSVVITDFQIFNKPVPIDAEIDGNTVLKRSITDCDEIDLSYRENVFSFEFAALHYASPKDNLYAYMMEGFEKEWNYTTADRRFVTYTNLPAGDYTFHVIASNNQGVWNNRGASIRIIITPPFWQTLWFKFVVVMVLLGIAFLSYRRLVRARMLAEKRRIDEALAEERNLLRTLIDNLPDYVYVKNSEGMYIIGNSAAVHQLGFSSERELLGKSDFNLFPWDVAEKNLTDEQKILESGKGTYESEGPVVDLNKEEKNRWISTTKVPFQDVQGKIIGTVAIGRDITERKHIEEERESLIAELQNALAEVKMLSGLVPICSNCKKIRDDQGYWTQVEAYIQKHSEAKFSHGICPDCMKLLYPEMQ